VRGARWTRRSGRFLSSREDKRRQTAATASGPPVHLLTGHATLVYQAGFVDRNLEPKVDLLNLGCLHLTQSSSLHGDPLQPKLRTRKSEAWGAVEGENTESGTNASFATT
jgi:hypothetical protein